MSRHDPEPSVWIGWVAFLTLPLMVFLTRMGWYGMRVSWAPAWVANGATVDDLGQAMEVGRWVIVGGMIAGGLAGLVVGPHLVAGVGVAVLAAGCAWVVADPGALSFWLASAGAGLTWVSLLAASGVSTGGGAPGLRYGTVVAIYGASNAAGTLAPLIAPEIPWLPSASAAAALMVLPAPLLTWWIAKRRPRVPDEGATGRVAVIGGLIFVLLLSAQATMSLLEPLNLQLSGDWAYAVNPAVVMVTALVTVLAMLALQVARLPSRLGVMAGAGALILSVCGTLAWSMGPGAPALTLLALVGIAEVLLYPWAFARMTSDTHWRLATVFAAFAMLPPYVMQGSGTIVAVVAAMVVSVMAIPIAGLGWMADQWIFGDEPGPIERRRGHRG